MIEIIGIIKIAKFLKKSSLTNLIVISEITIVVNPIIKTIKRYYV